MQTRREVVRLACLTGLLLMAVPATRAGDWDPRYWHCPKSSYSPLHYWAPELYCGVAYLNPHPRYLYSADRHPEVPKNYNFAAFPCPAAVPAEVPYSYPFLNIKPPAPKPPADPKATPAP